MSWYQYRGERIPERPLEPPDCWGENVPEPDEPEYDRYEDELECIHNRGGKNNVN